MLVDVGLVRSAEALRMRDGQRVCISGDGYRVHKISCRKVSTWAQKYRLRGVMKGLDLNTCSQ